MKIIGLTGKTGAGKSTVAALLSERGFAVVDGDVIARKIVEKGSPVLGRLADAFGADILEKDGSLNRKLLAERAFSSEEKRLLLNEITHGEIDRLIRSQLAEAERAGFKAAVIDAAALLESPSRALCEKIIVVEAEKETRLRRILLRDGLTEAEALRRIDAQKDDEFYRSGADFLISNNDGDDPRMQVALLSERLVQEEAQAAE